MPNAAFYKRPEWQALRLRALARDGYRCRVCHADVSGWRASRVDHVKSIKTHPHLALELDNLRTLCVLHDAQAHREKGTGSPFREARFTLPGCDSDGFPLGPTQLWRK